MGWRVGKQGGEKDEDEKDTLWKRGREIREGEVEK